jgi:hypothetical protein
MTLTNGAPIGLYEIAAFIGAGGMREVYRGADKRLKRAAAIEILPPAVACDTLQAWGRNGKEVFRVRGDWDSGSAGFCSAMVEFGARFRIGRPTRLFGLSDDPAGRIALSRQFDVSPDEDRFPRLVRAESDREPKPAWLILILRWHRPGAGK